MNAHLSEIRAAANTHSPELPGLIMRFLAAATDSSEEYWKKRFWLDVMDDLNRLQEANNFSWKPPIVLFPEASGSKMPWLYIGREWYFWKHIFTHWYNWSEDYIANLEIEEAFALMQEICTQEQLEKEWQYALSEKSMVYNASTKKSTFHPLPRPNWMIPSQPKKGPMKLPKKLIPVGEILDPSGVMKQLEKQNEN